MNPQRPLSLTIIAWLFIIVGLFSVLDIISGLWQQHFTLNLGVVSIFIGRGLLKLRPAALSWALGLSVLGLLSVAIAFIVALFGGGVVHFGHQILTGGWRLLAIFGSCGIYGTLFMWMVWVLRRPDVEALFQNPSEYRSRENDGELPRASRVACEAQRASVPKPKVGAKRLPWVVAQQISSTATRLWPFRHSEPPAATSLRLFSFRRIYPR